MHPARPAVQRSCASHLSIQVAQDAPPHAGGQLCQQLLITALLAAEVEAQVGLDAGFQGLQAVVGERAVGGRAVGPVAGARTHLWPASCHRVGRRHAWVLNVGRAVA